MYERSQLKLMLERIKEPKKTIMVISGPRQCGKTTAVGQMIDQCGIPAYSFSADNVSTEGNAWIIERWESARNRMDAEGLEEAILVMDEVQKIRNWSEAVKSEWDYDMETGRNLKVVLLGSSRLLLQKGLEESLAGRFEKIDMTFWTYDEMHEAFGMSRDQYIYFGGFPGMYAYISDESRWRAFMESSIVSPFLQKDLTELEEIRNPSLLSKVFSVGSALSGKEISVNRLHDALNSGSNPTISSYLSLLDKTMILKPLFKYRTSAAEKKNSSPKMQVYHNGFLTVCNNTTFTDVRSNNTLWGQWVESAVGAFLLNKSLVHGFDIMYWRETKNYKDKHGKSRNGTFEVDFVLKKGFSVVAIEVKSNRADSLSGIEEFRKNFSENSINRLTCCLVVGSQGLTFEDFCRLDFNRLFMDTTLSEKNDATLPLSRLDKGQKHQLELIGRVDGTVWLDGDEFLVQKDSKDGYLKKKSRDVYDYLMKNPPLPFSELGISVPAVLMDLAKGHTISMDGQSFYFDIESNSVKQGKTYAEALVQEHRRIAKASDFVVSVPRKGKGRGQ